MTLRSPHELVMEWHNTYAVPIGSPAFPHWPGDGDPTRIELRLNLIREEAEELENAVLERDLVETVDALADLVYVIYGMAIEMGVNLDYVLKHVQDSNMSKLGSDGKPIYREDGKVLKGPNFFPPDIDSALSTMAEHF